MCDVQSRNEFYNILKVFVKKLKKDGCYFFPILINSINSTGSSTSTKLQIYTYNSHLHPTPTFSSTYLLYFLFLFSCFNSFSVRSLLLCISLINNFFFLSFTLFFFSLLPVYFFFLILFYFLILIYLDIFES